MTVKDTMRVGVAGSGSGVGVEVSALAGTHVGSARSGINYSWIHKSGMRRLRGVIIWRTARKRGGGDGSEQGRNIARLAALSGPS